MVWKIVLELVSLRGEWSEVRRSGVECENSYYITADKSPPGWIVQEVHTGSFYVHSAYFFTRGMTVDRGPTVSFLLVGE
jgi:hypothetical protein